MKRLVVVGLERACTLLHPVTHRRPLAWARWQDCALAMWSYRLDERWATGVWKLEDRS